MSVLNLDNEICKYRSSLEAFAFKFTGDVEDANDLVQDTILKAIRYMHLYKKETNLAGWLYIIMKNTFINNYRYNVRRRAVISSTDNLLMYQTQKNSAANVGENKFILKDIHTALATLEPEYSTPFLRYFEGYKYHEIAIEMDIPIGTVKTRIHIARQLLKSQLKMYKSRALNF
jgi:RNA polymerase sigma factor (sigma-70 family)